MFWTVSCLNGALTVDTSIDSPHLLPPATRRASLSGPRSIVASVPRQSLPPLYDYLTTSFTIMLTLRHILSILAGSRAYDPIRTQMKQSHRYRGQNSRQRSTPARVVARQSPSRRPVPNWKSLKRYFARPQSADSKRTKPHLWSNPINKVTDTIDTEGHTTEGPDWTAWDDDTVEGGLEEEHGHEAITHTSGCPKAANRAACQVPNKKPLLPIPPFSAKGEQICASHTPVTPLDTYIKPTRPLTRSGATSKSDSFQSISSDTSSRSPRSSTPGLTDSSSGYSSASPVSTPRSGSPTFRASSNCTLTTTLLHTPPPSPIVPKHSPPIPVYQPVFRPASPYPHTTFSAPSSHLPARHAY